MIFRVKNLLLFAALALCAGMFPQAANAQGAYVRSGGYSSDCLIRPKFERPEFVKSSFDRPEFVRPEHLRRIVTAEQRLTPQFEYPSVLQPQFLRPDFHRCTSEETRNSGSKYRAVGFATAPKFGNVNESVAPSTAPSTFQAAPVVARAKPDADYCCGAKILTPTAATAALR